LSRLVQRRLSACRALGAKQRAQNRHLYRLVPRDAEGLRRAILLAEVLGPPRSLDRSDPFKR
jgi:hypothetical protein